MSINKKQEASRKTTRKLIDISKELFAKNSYASTSLEEIVGHADMTRGALYHHFKNKKELFLAVLTDLQEKLGQHVEQSALSVSDPWEQLYTGCIAFLNFATLDEHKRILLIDAPALIDWEEWRTLDSKNSLHHLKEQLEILQKQNYLKTVQVDLATHLISGALNDLALFLAENPAKSADEIEQVVRMLLEGFHNGKKD